MSGASDAAVTADAADAPGTRQRRPEFDAVGIWLATRTTLASFVLALALNVFAPETPTDWGTSASLLVTLVAFVFVSSFAIAAYWRRTNQRAVAGMMLLGADVVAVTGAVAITGGAGSVLTVLYGAVVVGAAITVGARSASVAGGLCLASYGFVGLGMALEYVPHPSDQLPTQYLLSPEDLAFATLSNVIAMTLVTMLSHFLATEREKAGGALALSEEDRLRLTELNEIIVRSIGTGLLTVEPSGVVTSANRAARELLALPDDPRAALGQLSDYFPATLQAGPDVDRDETVARRADGSTFPAGYSKTPLRAEGDAAPGALLAFQDLTRLRQLEQAHRDAEKLATLGRVAATLAHEIRNPLGSISGSVELVRESPSLGEEDKSLLTLVVGEVERLDELVHTMLDVARPRQRRLERFDLALLVRDVCRMVATGHGQAGVEVVSDAPEALTVVADADMIRQVLWNLVRNAIQSSTTGSTVRVRATGHDAGFELHVEDEGAGIPVEEVLHIFDPFRTTRTRGAGLGLTLVKQVVDAHEGTIRVEPRDPRGTAFRIAIPKLREPSSVDPIQP